MIVSWLAMHKGTPFKGAVKKLHQDPKMLPKTAKKDQGDANWLNKKVDTSEKEFLNISKVAPAPSRDYFNLRVTAKEVSEAKIIALPVIHYTEVGMDSTILPCKNKICLSKQQK